MSAKSTPEDLKIVSKLILSLDDKLNVFIDFIVDEANVAKTAALIKAVINPDFMSYIIKILSFRNTDIHKGILVELSKLIDADKKDKPIVKPSEIFNVRGK